MALLNVITVHYQSERWIELQLRALGRYAPEDTRLWASLDGIDPAHRTRFHYATELEASHPQKLNHLAELVVAEAAPHDMLLFLDGDAFPIAPVTPDLLGAWPLAAVRRDENLDDRQPHPSFCLTTAGFWRKIEGDWQRGYRWTNRDGVAVTDSGGNLLGALERRHISWRAFTRLNTFELHPLWFGVYGDERVGPIAYHHGAGFRPAVSRVDAMPGGFHRDGALAGRRGRFLLRVPLLARLERRRRLRSADRKRARWMRTEGVRQQRLADEVYQDLLRDQDSWRRFVS